MFTSGTTAGANLSLLIYLCLFIKLELFVPPAFSFMVLAFKMI